MKGESAASVKVRPRQTFDPGTDGAWCDRCHTTGRDGEYVASVLIDGKRVLQLVVCSDCAYDLGGRRQ